MASSAERKKLALRAAQLLLNSSGAALADDGVWGPRSASALSNASPDLTKLVSNVRVYADSIADSESAPAGTWIDKTRAMEMIRNASALSGVPVSWLEFMLELEPERRDRGGKTLYRVDSVSPGKSYFGLMQVGRGAWADARVLHPFIGDFERNKFDPSLNIMAAAGFAQRNIGYASSIHGYDGPFNAELIYAMHNQGHTFISSVKNGGKGRYYAGQSRDAKRILDSAASFVRDELTA